MKAMSDRSALLSSLGGWPATVFLTLPALLGSCAPGADEATSRPVSAAVEHPRQVVGQRAAAVGQAAAAGGFASSVDAAGTPTFIRALAAAPPAPGLSHEAAARFHAARFAPAFAAPATVLALASPTLIADHGAGGVVVHLQQRVAGLEVYGRELRLLMRQDHSLVAISGGLHPSSTIAGAKGASAVFARPPEAALATALSHAVGLPVAPAAVIDLHDADDVHTRYQLRAGEVVMSDPAVLKRVLFPDGETLRPAWFIEFYAGQRGKPDEAFRYLIAADDANEGKVLEHYSLTQFEAFNYRVWVDPKDNRPLDGPIADWTPHPTGHADWSYPPFIPPNMVSMEGFNKNPSKKADPWLAADATETQGNNVDCYIDRGGMNQASAINFRAKVTSLRTFDRVYDVYAPPNKNNDQAMAGITQAFYDTNWLHDYWYDSGFNEAAGNAQQNNFGRGGRGNDRMRVETQDGLNNGSRDNANMSTPSDGAPPRMQMFVWSGAEQKVLRAPAPLGDLPAGSASFGPAKFDLTGLAVAADDGTSPATTDICQPVTNAAAIAGNIAVIDRGTCTFKTKVVNAELAGAIGVIILNNRAGNAPGMGNGDPAATTVRIPVLSTTQAAGDKLRSAMAAGPVMITLRRVSDIDRDGGLENPTIFHEWGHYLHHRLADCGASQQCGAISEGWGDFVALHSVARDGDNLNGTYADSIYGTVSFEDAGYFGIRRQPYSVDFRKNALTFKHISDGVDLPERQLRNLNGVPNSEVHNAGEIWTTMMWEAYVALQQAGRARKPALSFDMVRRRMASYVVAGLQMTPRNATYTESRDAIMVAAGESDPADQQVIAEAFARRGAGTCANSPARNSLTLEGVTEGFTVQPRLVVGEVTLDDSVKSCDNDLVLDAGETGKITINLANGALQPLQGATLTLSTKTPGITFVGPTTFNIPPLDPFATTTVTAQVTLDPKAAQPTTFTLKVEPSANARCTDVSDEISWKINYDFGKQSTTRDEGESIDSGWKLGGSGANGVWSIATSGDQNRVWHGANLAQSSDTWIESPDLVVNPSQFFVMRFEHRHSFEGKDETKDNITVHVNYDGGAIEISDDGGTTWKDIAMFADPAYTGTVSPDNGTQLSKRKVYVGTNPQWPKRDKITMNLLDAFAGKTVRVRFRIVSDEAEGDSGWDLDNISFSGIDNTPFSGVVADAGKCGEGPRGMMTIAGGGCALAPRRPLGFVLFGFAAPLALLLLRRRRRA